MGVCPFGPIVASTTMHSALLEENQRVTSGGARNSVRVVKRYGDVLLCKRRCGARWNPIIVS